MVGAYLANGLPWFIASHCLGSSQANPRDPSIRQTHFEKDEVFGGATEIEDEVFGGVT